MTLYTRAQSLFSRLTGREAAALRYQRDAHAEEAGRERQKRMAAERSALPLRTAFDATARALRLAMTPGDDIHRQVTDRAIGAAAAALRAENPALHLDIAAVCGRVRERDRMETELLDAVARGDQARRERGEALAHLRAVIGGVRGAWSNAVAYLDGQRSDPAAAIAADLDTALRLLHGLRRATAEPAAMETALSDALEWVRTRDVSPAVPMAEHLAAVESATAHARLLGEMKDAAIGHLRAVCRVTPEQWKAIGAAREWLDANAPLAPPGPSGAVEQEGSRGGLAWMPGEHEATLESEGEER